MLGSGPETAAADFCGPSRRWGACGINTFSVIRRLNAHVDATEGSTLRELALRTGPSGERIDSHGDCGLANFALSQVHRARGGVGLSRQTERYVCLVVVVHLTAESLPTLPGASTYRSSSVGILEATPTPPRRSSGQAQL